MAIKGLDKTVQVYNENEVKSLKVLVVHARWNKVIIDALLEGAINKMTSLGVETKNIFVESVPGSFELPYAVEMLSRTGEPGNPGPCKYDAIIAIGVLIKGDTSHYEYICESVTHQLMRAQSVIAAPIIYGVLTCLTEEQALARAGISGNMHNHGDDWGAAAVEMSIKKSREPKSLEALVTPK